MKNTRSIFRWFLAFAFVALAAPALAAAEKKYTLDVSPTIVTGPVQKMTVFVNNVSTGGNSNINSMKIYLPQGPLGTSADSYTLKVDGTHPVTHTWTGVTFSAPDGGTVIAIPTMASLRPNNSFKIEFYVNVPACGTQSSWATPASTPTAWTGTGFNSNETFRLVSEPEASVNTKTKVGGTPSIAFDSTNPTSALKNADVVLKVKLLDGCSAPASGTVTLSSSPLSFTGTPSQPTASGVATFTVQFTALGATTLSATATGFGTATAGLTVFDGILGCNTGTINALSLPTSGDGTFDASEGGNALGETGFVFGVRAFDPAKGVCPAATKLNYTVVNNIPADDGDPTLPDPLDNDVYPGFYSLTWDANQTDGLGNLLRPIIAVVATYRSEWGDATTGLPTHKTLICTASPCNSAPYTDAARTIVNTAGGWKPAVACLSSFVLHSSIPTGEPGCLVSERWDLVNDVDPPDPDYCTGTPPSATPRCLKPTSIMLMGQDPIWGR